MSEEWHVDSRFLGFWQVRDANGELIADSIPTEDLANRIAMVPRLESLTRSVATRVLARLRGAVA